MGALQNEALRQISTGLTWTILAERAGYVHNGRASTTTVKRRLQLAPESHEPQKVRTFMINYSTAIKLIGALECDPVDFEL